MAIHFSEDRVEPGQTGETAPSPDDTIAVPDPRPGHGPVAEPWLGTIPSFRDEAIFRQYMEILARRRDLEPDEDDEKGTLSLRLPESLHRQLLAVVEREGVSISQFVATAVAEKLSALMTVDDLEERAARGDRARFERVLAKVRDVMPDEGDDL